MKRVIIYFALFAPNLLYSQLPKEFALLLNKAENPEEVVDIYNDISRYYRAKDYSLGILFADSALILAKKSKYFQGQVVSYNRKGVIFKNRGDYKRAITFYDSALSILSKIEFLSGKAMTYNNLGVANERLGKLSESYEYYKKSLKLKLRVEDSLGAANTYNNLGKLFRIQGGYDSALIFYQKALELRTLKGNKSLVLSSLLSLGNFLTEIEAYDSALVLFEESLSLSEETSNLRDEARSLNGLGIAKFRLNEFQSALKYFRKALPIYKSFKVPSNLIPIYLNLGSAYLSLDNQDSATNYYNLSLSLSKEIGYKQGVMQAENNLGNISKAKEEFTDALVYYRRAQEVAEQLNAKSTLQFIFYSISECYAKLNDYEKAYEYYKNYAFLHDTLVNQERNRTMTELRTKYDVSSKEVSLQNNKIRLLEYERKNEAQRSALILLGLILLIVCLILYSVNLKRVSIRKTSEKINILANQKINDLLQQQEINSLQGVLAGQEEERQRIATDLHDKLGAILGMVKLHFSAVEERIDGLRDDNKKQYDKANDLLDQASSEVRNISHNLLSGVLVKFGLIPALQDLKDTVEATGKLKVQLVAGEQTGGRLNGEQELQIYRIVQELISNILKHAKATEAVIQLNRTNGEINLIVEDNGIGFDVESARQKQGIGLKNLEARAAKLNAKLHFDSGKGAGTTVSVDIPLNSGDL